MADPKTASFKIDTLETIKEVLKEIEALGKTPFLVGGSALWAYRNNSLPRSKSFGIGVWGIDGQKELYDRLNELGYKMDNVIGSVVQATKDIQIMVFFLQKEGDEWYSYRHHVGKYLSIPDKFHNLEKIEFNGLSVPSPIEDYLLWTYGEKWRDDKQTNHSFPPARCFKE